VKTNPACDVPAYKIVSRAGVQERNTLLIADLDVHLHGVLRADAGNDGQGDLRGFCIIGCRLLFIIGVTWLFHQIILYFQIEQRGALVSLHVRLITIVA